jgi:hypothetical protein
LGGSPFRWRQYPVFRHYLLFQGGMARFERVLPVESGHNPPIQPCNRFYSWAGTPIFAPSIPQGNFSCLLFV